MLGLPDRESSPEEVDDDGLKRLFSIPPDVESLSNGLESSSSAPKPPPPAPEPVSSASALEPVSSVSAQSLCPLPPPQSLGASSAHCPSQATMLFQPGAAHGSLAGVETYR
jgi:hypothetical protein